MQVTAFYAALLAVLSPVLPQVFTDDHAPIEWIVNDMVMRFILEGRTEFLQ